MHSKALVGTHLFSNTAESLDLLRQNHEIAGNAGSENKCADRGGGSCHNVQRGGTLWKCAKSCCT